MKKIILSILTIFIGISLVSCGKSEEKIDFYKISIVENANCKLALSNTEANANDIITVYVTEIEEGYFLSKITANNMKIDGNQFVMPKEDVVIEAHLDRVESNDGPFRIDIVQSEYAVISTEKNSYSYDELVEINYDCKGSYVLDKFYINGKEIYGNTFKMPRGNVIIEGTFVDVLVDTDWQIAVESGTNVGRAHWYFSYGETALNVKVIVEDRFVCGYPYSNDTAWKDNVELILSPISEGAGWNPGKTFKFLVSCEGGVYIDVASSSTTFLNIPNYSSMDFGSMVQIKSLENKDGYNGYEISMFISYSFLGLTKEEALGNLTACLAMRNVNAFGASIWGFFAGETGNWENSKSHPIISADGSLIERG